MNGILGKGYCRLFPHKPLILNKFVQTLLNITFGDHVALSHSCACLKSVSGLKSYCSVTQKQITHLCNGNIFTHVSFLLPKGWNQSELAMRDISIKVVISQFIQWFISEVFFATHFLWHTIREESSSKISHIRNASSVTKSNLYFQAVIPSLSFAVGQV